MGSSVTKFCFIFLTSQSDRFTLMPHFTYIHSAVFLLWGGSANHSTHTAAINKLTSRAEQGLVSPLLFYKGGLVCTGHWPPQWVTSYVNCGLRKQTLRGTVYRGAEERADRPGLLHVLFFIAWLLPLVSSVSCFLLCFPLILSSPQTLTHIFGKNIYAQSVIEICFPLWSVSTH